MKEIYTPTQRIDQQERLERFAEIFGWIATDYANQICMPHITQINQIQDGRTVITFRIDHG